MLLEQLTDHEAHKTSDSRGTGGNQLQRAFPALVGISKIAHVFLYVVHCALEIGHISDQHAQLGVGARHGLGNRVEPRHVPCGAAIHRNQIESIKLCAT